MSMFETIFVVSILLYCWLIWTPILLLNSYRMWQHRKEKSFLKRHPKHVYAFFGIAWIEIVVDQPISLLVMFFDWELTHQGHVILYAVKSFFLIGVFLVFLNRCWLLYYDYRFNDASANLQWRLQFQPTYKTDNMWINRRSTFGNPAYCAKRATIVVFILFIIYTLTLIIFAHDYELQEGINLLAFGMWYVVYTWYIYCFSFFFFVYD